MQNKTNRDKKVVSPVLNRVAKWAIFVLDRVGALRPRRHSSSQTSLECRPPTPPPRGLHVFFNPLSPNSDQHQFSPNDIHTMSRD